MLYMNTINAGLPLAQKLASKQFVLSPIEGAPLSTLVAASYSPRLDMEEGSVAELINAASIDTDPSGINGHDEELVNVINLVSTSVEKTLNGARNIAGPIYRQVAEDVQEIVERERTRLMNAINVVPVYYHRAWNSVVLEGLVGRYGEQPVLDITLPATLPEVALEDILGYLKTGNSAFDDDVLSLVKDKTEDWVIDLYNSIFTGNGRGFDHVQEILQGRHTTRDELLCLHLISRRLLQDPPEGVRQSLNEYRSAMSTLVNQSGRAIARLNQLRHREMERKLLVYSYPAKAPELASKEGGSILVNGELYNKWIDEGGSPECLFGAYFDDRDKSYSNLLSKNDDYELLWERQRRLIAMRVSYQEKSVKLKAYQEALTSAVNALSEDDLMGPREMYHDRIKATVPQLREGMLDNYYFVARSLVCDVIFPHTDFKQVLVAIDRICTEQPELEVREAGLLATIEYVVDWVSKLAIVSKGKQVSV